MGSDRPQTFAVTLSGWKFWLGAAGLAVLLSTAGLGWLVTLLLAGLLLLLALPILVVLAFRRWANRWIATDVCPVCRAESQALEGSRFGCPSCGEPLFVADGQFYRQTPPGTIEVELIED